MTNSDLNTLIANIESCLEGSPADQMPEVLAASYARACRDVNERLRRVGEMLTAGSELQALQYAEAPPHLPDRAVDLSFGREIEWQEQCRDRKLDIAPLIEADQLEAIQEVYRRGVSSGHPLYKEYRTAALSKDDKKAYELARLIVRMNPADSNALRELARLEKKEIIKQFERLKEAGASSDDDNLVDSLEELERTANAEELAKEPRYLAGVQRRREIERDALTVELPGLLKQMEELLSGEAEGWRSAAILHSQTASRLVNLDLQVSTVEEEQLRSLEGRIDKCRQETERLACIEAIAREFASIADDVQARAVTPLGLDKDYASRQLQKHLDLERELSVQRGSLPAASDSRRAAIRAQLEQSLERVRKRRRVKLVGSSLAVLTILLLASGYTFYYLRAGEREKLLVELRETGQSSAAAELVDELNGPASLLKKFPRLEAELVTTEQWIETAEAVNTQLDLQLLKLEAHTGEAFAAITPHDLHDRLVETGELVQQLPSDRAKEAEVRLTIIRNEADRFLVACQQNAEAKAQGVLSEVESAMEKIDFEGLVAPATQLAQDNLERILPLAAMSELKVPILRLPGTIESKVAGTCAELQQILRQAQDTQTALEELSQALTISGHESALRKLAGTAFKEADMAQRVVDNLPDERRQRAFILFKGNLADLSASEHLSSGDFPLPSAAAQIDRDVIRSLQSDPFLSTIWEVSWTRSGTAYSLISKGGLERMKDGSWSGSVALYPKHRGMEPKFADRTISPSLGLDVTKNEPSVTMQMFDALRLDLLLDATGTEYKASIISRVNRIFNNENADPLAKAYVLNQLFKLLRGREIEWGLYLIPELQVDMAEARNMEAKMSPGSSDWLITEKLKGTEIWEDYFKERSSRNYYNSLRSMLDIIQTTKGTAFLRAGTIQASGQALLEAPSEEMIVWGLCAAADGSVAIEVFGEQGPGMPPLEIPAGALPLSPIFGLPISNEGNRHILLGRHDVPSSPTNQEN